MERLSKHWPKYSLVLLQRLNVRTVAKIRALLSSMINSAGNFPPSWRFIQCISMNTINSCVWSWPIAWKTGTLTDPWREIKYKNARLYVPVRWDTLEWLDGNSCGVNWKHQTTSFHFFLQESLLEWYRIQNEKRIRSNSMYYFQSI